MRQWNFSFRYLKQIDLFGTGDKDGAWFVSVLEKISDLSAKQVSEVLSTPAEKLRWRLHEIDWSHRSIPIRRSDLNWIDKKYLDNDDEYPFWQFSVSKALGRIVGFWDERGIFNIVLLDPSHNIQPSAYSDYKTREAPIGKGEFEIAITEIEARIGACGQDCRCRGLYDQIQSSLTHRLQFSTMLVAMPDALFVRVSGVIQEGLADCVSDLLEIAIDELDKLLLKDEATKAATDSYS
ncbi:hypothetical protein D4Q52_13065 [Rhodopseudomonas palustris]|uniref:Uncharacterized protein n=1 Tax=Rhodopseudomonas palustris TaxID=1076 RepID=A0A418VD67_RHOPL|nr:hypothetical protein D4Q52_13065 [Rhodopseudomonas palustris]